MLESTTRHLEATSTEDVPPRSWERIASAAEAMAARLFPEGSVALRAVSDTEIRELNARYRGVDEATDVLSFPADLEWTSERPGGGGSQPANHVGDLAISWDALQRQARANGNEPEEEAIALIAHGMLHLAGYDHETEAEDARMHSATLKLLRHVGVTAEIFGH